MHYRPLTALEGYTWNGVRVNAVVRTSTTPSLYYGAFGWVETGLIARVATFIFPDRPPEATDFCIVETVYGFSSCDTNPFNIRTSRAVHNARGAANPPPFPSSQDAGVMDAAAPDASAPDAMPIDSGPPDTGVPPDSGVQPDAAAADAARTDTGTVADAGFADVLALRVESLR